MFQFLLFVVIVLILWILIIEFMYPNIITEGFQHIVDYTGIIPVGDSAIWAKWMPRRGDITIDLESEGDGYVRDIRYFSGYTDVQRLGIPHDFCRMIGPKSDPSDLFFTCALGGTEGMSSTAFRTPSTKNGFRTSRDDYMNSIEGTGMGYCRILKADNNDFEARCNVVSDTKFYNKTVVDTKPPKNIRTLLSFYEGIMLWLRLKDDMVDYAQNLVVMKSGKLEINELPNQKTTRGLAFDGKSDYLRIGDNAEMEFGNTVHPKYMRAVCFWVYFEEFTNNAHIIDFGNGPASDNVWIGIVGRGNPGISDGAIIRNIDELSPQDLMESTSANINEYECKEPEIVGRKLDVKDRNRAAKPHEAHTANLVYEIWDGKHTKKHVQLNNAISLRKWIHVAITAENDDAFRPNLYFYIDGKKVHTENDGWLPANDFTTHNYIGKSNWHDSTSSFDNADELFKGRLFDLRVYNSIMTERKIVDTIQWGKELLGLESSD